MPAPSASASDPERPWLGHSLWQAPPLEISGVKSWGGITVMTYHRGDGESVWRGDRHRIGLVLDPLPSAVVQIGQGRNRQGPVAPGTLAFFPADLKVRVAHSATRLVQVLWDTDLYSILLPELDAATPRFELAVALQDPLLRQIITTLAYDMLGTLSGISRCRRAEPFHRNGCSGYATSLRRISMAIFHSRRWPISRA